MAFDQSKLTRPQSCPPIKSPLVLHGCSTVERLRSQVGSHVGGGQFPCSAHDSNCGVGNGGQLGSGSGQYGNRHHPNEMNEHSGAGCCVLRFGYGDADMFPNDGPWPPTKKISIFVPLTNPGATVLPQGVACTWMLPLLSWKISMCTTDEGSGFGDSVEVQLPVMLHAATAPMIATSRTPTDVCMCPVDAGVSAGETARKRALLDETASFRSTTDDTDDGLRAGPVRGQAAL